MECWGFPDTLLQYSIIPVFRYSSTPIRWLFTSHAAPASIPLRGNSMADKNHLILTAIGPDRVGLVEKISEFISRHDCNIEDSKMAAFCGEFAVIILITGEAGQLAKVARDYREIESETGLSVAVKAPSPRKTTEAFI